MQGSEIVVLSDKGGLGRRSDVDLSGGTSRMGWKAAFLGVCDDKNNFSRAERSGSGFSDEYLCSCMFLRCNGR